MVPPAAIGAICAAAAIVVCFVGFKLVYALWKRHQILSSRRTRANSDSASRDDQEDFDPVVFQPPPSYAQCVTNPAFTPEDSFKPPDFQGLSGRPEGPPPPAYDRILSGEFRELSAAELRRMMSSRSAQMVTGDRNVVHMPRELRPNRSSARNSDSLSAPRQSEAPPAPSGFTGHASDGLESQNHSGSNSHEGHSGSTHQQLPSSIDNIVTSYEPFGEINPAFSHDEFDDILSAMQLSAESHSFPVAISGNSDLHVEPDPSVAGHNTTGVSDVQGEVENAGSSTSISGEGQSGVGSRVLDSPIDTVAASLHGNEEGTQDPTSAESVMTCIQSNQGPNTREILQLENLEDVTETVV